MMHSHRVSQCRPFKEPGCAVYAEMRLGKTRKTNDNNKNSLLYI